MLRVRFRANIQDPRPINWPVKHPYWVTGEGEHYAVIVSYADDRKYILANWPEASHLEIEEQEGYTFTDRFPKPKWFEEQESKLTKRSPDACPECAGSGKTGSIGLPHECPFCDGTGFQQ